ncbi:hypothetical protein IEQ34_023032 [Dendrobium chrysotoxum]|uniref:Uncharacterized protein n=1 Tax=Dendrobium chrysotoxum TaxID=161865 RepID=A0AAV7FZD2_DENCH|nr:hypothetical protein IEQ34_023032 [Dendrobium chrysotoxum]
MSRSAISSQEMIISGSRRRQRRAEMEQGGPDNASRGGGGGVWKGVAGSRLGTRLYVVEIFHTTTEDVLLHGDLDLYIIEARNLPNKDMFTEQLRRCFTVCSLALPFRSKPRSLNHHHHPKAHIAKAITRDPYVTILFTGATDNYVCGAQLIGNASIPAGEMAATGELVEKWLQILGPSGPPLKHAPSLHVKLRFTPASKNPIAGNPQRLGVQGTYFPVRRGGMVTLYQDAHVKEMDLQAIHLEEGRVFRQGTCWEDMCHAILKAHQLIYIVGWSIYDKVRLVH